MRNVYRFKLFPILLALLVIAACGNTGSQGTSVPTTEGAQPEIPTAGAPVNSPADSVESTLPQPTGTEPLQTPPQTQIFLPTVMVTSPATPAPPGPAAFPNPDNYEWQPAYSGLNAPIGMAAPGDGTGRVFFIEQQGRIQVGQDGSLAPQPFLDITDRVGSQSSEQGLLGLAFHPDFGQNGFFYVNYTGRDGNTVIARYSVSGSDLNQADPGSEKVLLRQDQPYANHNGGVLAFGPDGYLYIGLGDGGSGGDPQGNAQNLDTWLGKILRIDVDGGDPYAIPSDNPFASGGGKPEIWAYGLRNPWRFSFDRQTGDLYTGDVGQGTHEEIDFQAAGSPGGENYGWNIMEGPECFQSSNCDQSGLVPPVSSYLTHREGTCAVTGGYVYRGAALPEWNGIYLFGDYCGGQVWGLFREAGGAWQDTLLFNHPGQITSFGQDDLGEVYLVDYGGTAFRLSPK